MRRFDDLADAEKNERLLHLAEKALAGYGLTGELKHVATATHTTFQLRLAGASYAVRISPSGYDHALLQRELVWLTALGRDTDLRVPEPILTVSGDLFRSVSMEGVPGTRACTVRRWIEGERREAELTGEEAAAIGQFVASLHRHAEGFHWPEELASPYVDPADRIVAAADTLRDALPSPDDRARLCDVAARIADAAGGVGEEAASVGVIHGDLRLRKLRHDGAVVGAFGFDSCRPGAYLEDLAVVWNELADRESSDPLRVSLFEGYQSIRALPPAPTATLRGFAQLRALEQAVRACELPRIGRRVSPSQQERASSAVRDLLAST